MHISCLRVAEFRNVKFADFNFGDAQKIFLTGKNGQGKTNLLEAVSLLTALRSFRTRDTRLLVKHGQKQAQVFIAIEHELEGRTELTLTLSSNGSKTVESGAGIQMRRLSEFVGRFPTVVFSSDDIALLRGAPAGRRRWLDLTLSTINADYFRQLQRYHRALDSRNRLLKSSDSSENQFDAFEKILAESGMEIVKIRSREMNRVSELFSLSVAKIAQIEEFSKLVYEASFAGVDLSDWRNLFQRSRTQDRLLRATQKGPHRDDFHFQVFGRAAEDFASEGQQRGMTLSLGLAQLELFRERLGIVPVVLADDVLGELDPVRKLGFWTAVGEEPQIFATGTLPPENSEAWRVFSVDAGQYQIQTNKLV